MANYEVYFGTQERTLDSLTLLLEFPNHPIQETRGIGAARWLEGECTNQRWWTNKHV